MAVISVPHNIESRMRKLIKTRKGGKAMHALGKSAGKLLVFMIMNISVILGITTSASAMAYKYTELLPTGWGLSEAISINNSGIVVGWGRDSTYTQKGFLYSAGVYTELLPTGWTESGAFCINNSGAVAGAFTDNNSRGWGFIYSAGDYTELLPTGWSYAGAQCINNSGAVVGSGTDGNSINAGFLYSAGEYTELLPPGWSYAEALCINNSGAVVGWGTDSNGITAGFIYSAGVYTELLPTGWHDTEAFCINDIGAVVGWGYESNSNYPKGFLYSAGKYTELLPTGWDSAEALGINNSGIVVGWGGDSNGIAKAFIYSAGGYTELPPPPGWSSVQPQYIHDSEAIVGWGYDSNGTIAGFLAAPKTTATSTTTTISGNNTSTTTSEPGFFTVISNTPQDSSLNVDYEDPGISATFSMDVDSGTANAGTFIVSYIDNNASETAVTGVYVVDGNTVTFTPDIDLPDNGKDIFVTIKSGTNGIKAKDGTEFALDYTWSFTTVPNLTVEIIPVQVLENEDLVKDKPTVVRVKATWGTPMSSGVVVATDVPKLTADIAVSYDSDFSGKASKTGAEFFEPDANTVKGQNLKYYKGLQNFINHGQSVNFYQACLRGNCLAEVPIVGTAGSHTIHVTITPSGQSASSPRTFTADKTVNVVTMRDNFSVLYVPVAEGGWNNYEEHDIGNLAYNDDKTMNQLFPIARSNTMINEFALPIDPWYYFPLTGNYGLRCLKILAQTRWYTNYDIIIGVAPEQWMSSTFGADGVSEDSAPHAGLIKNTSKPPVAPHEMCHILHYDGGGDSQGHDANWAPYVGYDVGFDRYITSSTTNYTFPLMYVDIALYSQCWITNKNYEFLLSTLSAGASASMAKAKAKRFQAETGSLSVLYISGEIYSSGGTETAAIDGLYIADSGTPDATGTGDYSIELQNAAGTALETQSFNPTFTTDTDGSSYAGFMAALAYDIATAKVAIKHGSTVLIPLTKPQNAPTVSIMAPTAGQSLNGTTTLSWTSFDADGNTLVFTVLSSTDGGANWNMLARNLTDSSFTFDTALLTNSTTCKVKVIASDGFNSTEVVSDTFTVSNAAKVLGTSPASGATGISLDLEAITVRFRDAMDESTITTANIYLQDGSGTVVAAAVFYDSATKTATISPSASLIGSTTYTGIVTTGVKDTAGNALGAQHSWTFTTEADTTPPYYSSLNPEDGAKKVSVTQSVSATFSKAMNAGTISDQTFTLAMQAGGAVSGSVSYDAASRTVTFIPSGDLSESTIYVATLKSTIMDASGNALGGDVTWSFTTASQAETTTTTTTTTVPSGPCPATRVLGKDNPKLENLRDFRDSKLASSAIGRTVIQIYYNNAMRVNAVLEHSPALKAVARRVLEVFAPMVGKN